MTTVLVSMVCNIKTSSKKYLKKVIKTHLLDHYCVFGKVCVVCLNGNVLLWLLLLFFF